MKLDTSLTLTSIIAIVALISPILTALINNYYSLKIKELENNQKRYDESIKKKQEIFEKYCQTLSQVAIQHNVAIAIINEYASSYGKAILYMSPEDSQSAIEINRLIEERRFKSAFNLASNHILSIKKEVDKL